MASRRFTAALVAGAVLLLAATLARAAEPVADEPVGLDYSQWTRLTPKTVRVPVTVGLTCAPGGTSLTTASDLGLRFNGPHDAPAVAYLANPAAEKALAAGAKAPMPVGATIVKEKYRSEKDTKPSAYGAMIKREPGFDREHGDWEYLYVDFGKEGEKPVVTRGAIQSCVQCHSGVKEKDYLFRSHLTVKAEKKEQD